MTRILNQKEILQLLAEQLSGNYDEFDGVKPEDLKLSIVDGDDDKAVELSGNHFIQIRVEHENYFC